MTNPPQQFFEGCGREGPIRCIFLSEFHPVAGSKITCQVLHSSIQAKVKTNIFLHPIPGAGWLCIERGIRCGQRLYYTKAIAAALRDDGVS